MPELEDLDIREVSLVEVPANRRRWLLVKSQGGVKVSDVLVTDEEREAIEDALNSPIEDEESVLAELDRVSKARKAETEITDRERNILRGALRLLNSIKDVVGADVLAALAAKAGYGYAPPEKAARKAKPRRQDEEEQEEEYGYAKPRAKAKSEEGKAAKAEIPDDVVALAKAAVPEHATQILEAFGSAPDVMQALTPLLQAFHVLKQDNEARKAREEEAACRTAVEELGLPGDKERLVAFLKSMSPEARKEWLEIMRPAAEVVQRATRAMMSESGTSARAVPIGSALEEAQARAKAKVGKSEKGEMDALLEVFEEDPELFNRYRRETLEGGA